MSHQPQRPKPRGMSDQLNPRQDGEQEQHAGMKADHRQRHIDDHFRHPLEQVETLRRGEIELFRAVMDRMIGPEKPHLMHHAMEEIGPELRREHIGGQGPPVQRNAPVAVLIGQESQTDHRACSERPKSQVIDRGGQKVGDCIFRQEVALPSFLLRGPPFRGAQRQLDRQQQRHEDDDAARPILEKVLHLGQSDGFVDQLIKHFDPLPA